ncbi:hypothetical protein [Actinoplanes sp. NPDC048796]|uniref:hypothetical protein n=1 Tax=Actinoplanes sp. NPDC048796 TaxID=3155640 RepID=UPI0033FEE836
MPSHPHDAYGPATFLPDLPASLRAPDEQRRTAAMEQFRARALHQDSLYPAAVAAVPHLIDLLADDTAPDRTLGHELLTEILPEEKSEPIHRQAHQAVRAGVPTYLRLLDDPDRNARGLSAHLLSFFPEAAPQVTPALTARLAAETDRVVASFLCLTAGTIGGPHDTGLAAAVARWRDQPHRINRWTVLMGLVRLVETPDPDMLEQLCDCLFHGPGNVYGWTLHHESPVLGAALALGDLPAASVPGLAAMLTDRLAAGCDDGNRFYYAVRLLLGLTFPDGPSPQRQAATQAILSSELAGHPAITRLLQEHDLPQRPQC